MKSAGRDQSIVAASWRMLCSKWILAKMKKLTHPNGLGLSSNNCLEGGLETRVFEPWDKEEEGRRRTRSYVDTETVTK